MKAPKDVALVPGDRLLLVNQRRKKANGVYTVTTSQHVKVWITQYALTTGVYTAIVALDPEKPRLAVEHKPGFPSMVCYHKPHWWLTEAEARERFNQVRAAEQLRIAKQLERLATLKFKVKGRFNEKQPHGSGTRQGARLSE